MAREVDAEEVQQKAAAAVKWCELATRHELENDGKPWQYILIPHDAIQPSATLDGLVARFSKT
jgi:type III restriction enzyme